MYDLTRPVAQMKGIGEKKARVLEKLGLFSVADFLTFFPRDYSDRRAFKKAADLADGEAACVRLTLATPFHTARIRRGMEISKARAFDETGVIGLTFFNQTYAARALRQGEEYDFYGRVKRLPRGLEFTVLECENAHSGAKTGAIVPIYPLTAGVSQAFLRKYVGEALREAAEEGAYPRRVPEGLLEADGLPDLRFSYENIHFPESAEALEAARERLMQEEQLLFALGVAFLARRREGARGRRIAADPAPFFSALPFALTAAQRRAVDACLADLSSGAPMNRLVQGDVGSGKTMVAAACLYAAAKAGYQAALMAPTELLAAQHAHTLGALFTSLGVRTALLTGSMTAAEKRRVTAAVAAGEVEVLIGTHALIQKGVAFQNLALVVTDEQHRFGVRQRAALGGKGERAHTLVMSATPIPRTLALILYGDLDVSVIDELPPGRRQVLTYLVGSDKRARMEGFLRAHVAAGEQAYIVCPLVEENEETETDLKAAETYVEELRARVFPDTEVGLVHGKLRPAQKEAAMAAFAEGKTRVLVSTTVIEVGVDVPNATVMVVENAERFGLSQLHQLRGRVGRGERQSYCILVSDGNAPQTRERLHALCKTNDGFKIAEEDLKARGPGDFFGSRQHGLPAASFLQHAGDMRGFACAQERAQALLAQDAQLALPQNALLRENLDRLFGADIAYN